jgi:rubrerythrin
MDEHADFFSAAAAIGTIPVLDVDAMRLLFRVECGGETFYQLLADRIAHPEAAALLRRNGREERGHAERLRRAIAIKLGTPFEPTADDLAPYAIPLPDEISPELLQVIVTAELNGDTGYQRWADRETDPEIQRLLRLNGREETTHGERVTEVLALLRQATPAS